MIQIKRGLPRFRVQTTKGLVSADWCQGPVIIISLIDGSAIISSSRPNCHQAAGRSDGQGWPKAIAKRRALDGREHSGRVVGWGRR